MGKTKENSEKIEINLSFLETVAKYSEEDLSAAERWYADDRPVAWGARNTYSNLIQNCWMQSPTLRACASSFSNFVRGNGMTIGDGAAKWRGTVNRYGETLETVVGKMALSQFLYGGWCLQIVYSKMKTVAEIYSVDFSKCRVNTNKTKVFYYPKGCTNYGKYIEYDMLGFGDGSTTEMAWFNGTSAPTLYPSATWTAALSDVLTEIETSKFSLATVSGGFLAKYVISIPSGGNLSSEQKKLIEDSIKKKFTGSDADSNFMLFFGGADGQEIKVDKIEADNSAESFLAIRDTAKDNIYAACQTSPLIMGMGQGNTLSTNEFSDAYNIYNRTVIVPVQHMIEDELARVLRVDVDQLKINKFSLDFE